MRRKSSAPPQPSAADYAALRESQANEPLGGDLPRDPSHGASCLLSLSSAAALSGQRAREETVRINSRRAVLLRRSPPVPENPGPELWRLRLCSAVPGPGDRRAGVLICDVSINRHRSNVRLSRCQQQYTAQWCRGVGLLATVELASILRQRTCIVHPSSTTSAEDRPDITG